MRISGLLAVLLAVTLVSACGAEEPTVEGADSTTPSASASATATSTPAAEATARQQWAKARSFLASQTRQPEVWCLDTRTNRVEFFSFDSNAGRWRRDLVFRDDPGFKTRARQCSINVPTSVPYTTSGIEGFLNPRGWWFMNGSPHRELKRVEISYAGANDADPDKVFADEPGLWGARLAMGRADDLDFTRGFPAPRSEKQAERFLDATRQLLEWYGYPAA